MSASIKKKFLFGFVLMMLLSSGVFAVPVIRTASGANAAAIQSTVDQFRTDLGGSNNGVGNSFTAGRREINWDGVPDSFSAPNFLPVDFFNVNSPRGAVFSSRTTFGNTSAFLVSADDNNPTASPVRFGDINATYSTVFQAFSAQRLFAVRGSNSMNVNFFVPGTKTPATVSGFGVVFTDVDTTGPTYVKFYGVDDRLIGFATAPPANEGLSFVGVSFNAGERVDRVEIVSGNGILAPSTNDNGSSNDLVVMDDFIYGEPRARDHHANDFDGDGVADASIFRPSTGTFFVLNSGSNTVTIVPFGANGDRPVQGDFDGDSRSDVAIYRPAGGEWWIRRSSDDQVFATQFGAASDVPTPGDYDKDGLTDIAFWRPSNGNYFVLRSGNQGFFAFPFGANGDIPVASN